jgi:pantothenate kinase
MVVDPPSQVEGYVERLVCLFPGAVIETQKMMATLELEELVPTSSHNERVKLVEVSNVSAKVDRIMQRVATESIERVDERHRFLQNRAEDGVRAVYGDAYGKGAQFRLDGPGSVFQGNVATGHSTRASYGDRVNMPDLLTGASDSDEGSSEQQARG